MEKIFILDKETKITYYLVGIKSISPTLSAKLTEYSIPEGGTITDHSYIEANSLEFSLISDGNDNTKQSYYLTEDGNSVYLSYTALTALLNSWFNNATLLEIQTQHGFFNNMCLTKISWTEGSDSWTKFAPSLSFNEVKVAKLVTTTVSALNVSYSASYSLETDTGTASGEEFTSENAIGSMLGGAAVGAGIGAIAGSIIPGIGTGVGAVVGGVIGGVIGFFDSIF